MTDRPLRGHVKRKLLLELADDKKTMVQLANEYGVSQPAITAFRDRHNLELLGLQKTLDEEVNDLWIAHKANRIAEYQSNYEGIGDPGRNVGLIRVGNELLRMVAEELGQIPTKVGIQVNNQQIHYSIEGIDLEKLQ